jgi:hypothetical protein
MSSYWLPLLSVSVGALLGLLSVLVASSMRHRQDITLKLLDQYFEVRKEVVNVVSDLSNLKIRDEFDSQRRAEYRDLISKLFFKHYDFLPKPVLDSMTLLYVCLSNPEGGLYCIKGDVILPMGEADAVSFIEGASYFVNSQLLAPLALKSNSPSIRSNQSIILHARNVLNALNKYASIEDLLKMTKGLKKTSPI